MALTRKMLKAMGIEDEKIDQIIEAHTETVDALKEQVSTYKKDADKLPFVQKELDEIKAAAPEDKDSALKVKYDALKEEFDEYKQRIETEKSNSKKEAAFKALLKDVGISEKRVDAVTRVTDLKKYKLDDEGNLEGYDDIKKAIKDEWSEFIVSNKTEGAKTATPPEGKGKTYKNVEEIMAIKDTKERQSAIAENHEMFGF